MNWMRCVSMMCAVALPGATFGQANLLDSNPSSPTYNNPSFESPDVDFALNTMAKWQREGPNIFTDNPLAPPDLYGVGIFDNPPNDPNTPGNDGHLDNG